MNWFDIDTAIKGLLSFTAFLLVIGVFYLLGWWLWRILRVRQERKHTLNIQHHANFRAFYYLAVESPELGLRFQFLAGDKPLVEVVHLTTAAPEEKKAKTPAAKTAQKSPSAIEGAVDSGKEVMVKVGIFANIMGMVASFLPGSLGAKIKERQEQVKQTQQKALATAQAPQDAKRRLDALQSESQKLGVKAPDVKLPAAASPSQGQRASGTPAHSAALEAGSPAQTVAPPFEGLYCVQTVDLEPGQTLPIQLKIDALTRRRPVGSFAYTIHLQAMPAESLPEKLPHLSKRGTAHFASVAGWRFWMPGFSALLVFLLGLMSWLYLVAMIWK
jgi:hypothetical protein